MMSTVFSPLPSPDPSFPSAAASSYAGRNTFISVPLSISESARIPTPPVTPDNAVGSRQAQPSSDKLGRHKRIEDAVFYFILNAHIIVFDRDHNIIAGTFRMGLWWRFFHPDIFRRDTYIANPPSVYALLSKCYQKLQKRISEILRAKDEKYHMALWKNKGQEFFSRYQDARKQNYRFLTIWNSIFFKKKLCGTHQAWQHWGGGLGTSSLWQFSIWIRPPGMGYNLSETAFLFHWYFPPIFLLLLLASNCKNY